jgi:hypothetical protein
MARGRKEFDEDTQFLRRISSITAQIGWPVGRPGCALKRPVFAKRCSVARTPYHVPVVFIP